jgi:hypothetical protein
MNISKAAVISSQKKGPDRIWTPAAHELLYTELKKRFGPRWRWENHDHPGRGLDRQYDEFCEVVHKAVGANSAQAVQSQIAFTRPIPGKAHWDPAHTRQAIQNLTWALETGFIRASDLPWIIASGKELKSDD